MKVFDNIVSKKESEKIKNTLFEKSFPSFCNKLPTHFLLLCIKLATKKSTMLFSSYCLDSL